MCLLLSHVVDSAKIKVKIPQFHGKFFSGLLFIISGSLYKILKNGLIVTKKKEAINQKNIVNFIKYYSVKI